MRNRNTIEFLGLWETLHNPNFNRVQFDTFKNEAGLNRFVMTLHRKNCHSINRIKTASNKNHPKVTFGKWMI
jgi:hypothetical protein